MTGYICCACSPLESLDPLMVQFFIRLSKIGMPLTKLQIILLEESLMKGTETKKIYLDWLEKNIVLIERDFLRVSMSPDLVIVDIVVLLGAIDQS